MIKFSPLSSMREDRPFIITCIVIVTVLLIVSFCFLDSHYEWYSGYAVTILFYRPLSVWSRVILFGFGIMACLGVWMAYNIQRSNNIRIGIIAFILCLLISLMFGIFGNQILGSRTEHWPHEYKVQPLNTSGSKAI